MKKLSLLLIGLLLVPSLLFISCDRGDDPEDGVVTTAKFTLMKTYMEDNNLDINYILTNTDGEKFVVGAPAEADLATFLSTYHIIDIRSASFYAAGHIEGAVNVPPVDGDLSGVLTEAANATKPILMVCYTGQAACYATALLRLYGYSHTKALKWGMSGWNSTTDSWSGKVTDVADGNVNWVYSAAPSVVTFDDPVITTSLTDGEAILKAQVEAVLAGGLKGVSGSDVLNGPSGYFVNNYFSEADYSAFGHISGAYRINPLTLTDGTYKNLDPNQKIVTYCYTGQTSAIVTACLNVLGYDAYSMLFGVNGVYNSNPSWASNQWGVDSNPKDLPLVTN